MPRRHTIQLPERPATQVGCWNEQHPCQIWHERCSTSRATTSRAIRERQVWTVVAFGKWSRSRPSCFLSYATNCFRGPTSRATFAGSGFPTSVADNGVLVFEMSWPVRFSKPCSKCWSRSSSQRFTTAVTGFVLRSSFKTASGWISPARSARERKRYRRLRPV